MSRSSNQDSVFQAIASPTRRALLDALALGETNVSDLVATLDITQSAVSQQLTILKDAGLVEDRVEGRFRYHRLCVAPLVEVDVWINRYRVYMEQQLDALGRVLDGMPDEKPDQKPHEKPKPARSVARTAARQRVVRAPRGSRSRRSRR